MQHTLKQYLSKLSSIKKGFLLLSMLTFCSLAVSFFPVDEIESYSKFVAMYSIIGNTMPEATPGFQPRFESWIFIGLVALLGFSLISSIYSRSKAELYRIRNGNSFSGSVVHTSDEFQTLTIEVAKILQKRRYGVAMQHGNHRDVIIGRKGERGIIGSLSFHSGLLIILLGIIVSSVASFRASVSLTEGQAFDSRHDRFGFSHQGAFYIPPKDNLSFRLVKVEPEKEVNGSPTIASFLIDGSGLTDREISVYINHGIVLGGREIHQGAKVGFSPFIRITRKDGEVLFEGFLRLAVVRDNNTLRHRDFLLLDGDKRIEFEFLPDAVFRDGQFGSRSDSPGNPFLGVAVNDGAFKSETKWIPVGSGTRAGDLAVSFFGVRRWSQLDIVDDPGKNVMLFGAILGSVGLALRLLCVRKQVKISLTRQGDRTVLEVDGTAEKFPAEFHAELASLRVTLQLALLDIETNSADSRILPPKKKSHPKKLYEEWL